MMPFGKKSGFELEGGTFWENQYIRNSLASPSQMPGLFAKTNHMVFNSDKTKAHRTVPAYMAGQTSRMK